MSVFITDGDAKQKISEVEGDVWMQKQVEGPDFTFDWAVTRLLSWRTDRKHQASLRPDEATGIVIYGRDSWNRYFVLANGEICFSRKHASSLFSMQRAERAGFRLI